MKRTVSGGTGISVSQFALGAMMFGGWGNTTTQTACGSSAAGLSDKTLRRR